MSGVVGGVVLCCNLLTCGLLLCVCVCTRRNLFLGETFSAMVAIINESNQVAKNVKFKVRGKEGRRKGERKEEKGGGSGAVVSAQGCHQP